MKKQLWKKRSCFRCNEIYVTTARSSRICPSCQNKNCIFGCYMSVEEWEEKKKEIENINHNTTKSDWMFKECQKCGTKINSHIGYCNNCKRVNCPTEKNKKLNNFIKKIKTLKEVRKEHKKIYYF